MSLRLGFRNGDRIIPTFSCAAGLSDDGHTIDPTLLDVSREFAFSSKHPDEFAHWYLLSEVFSKYDDGDPATKADKVSVAMQKFQEAEAQCAEANSWIVGWDCYTRFTTSVWQRARAIVRDVLGPFPWERFPAACQFGPGASLGLPRRKASQSNKWDVSTHITGAALPYYMAFKRWSNIDLPYVMSITDGNRVTTVPKSYKTDRTIAIEPDWNAFLQRGVGTLIRSRLRRRGLLTPDAQDVHRQLAQAGSALGHLATLDMSMASDSVSLALCEALLPADWWRVVVDLRSPLGRLPGGDTVAYAKVSSMGNGFTFELETLLFYALTAAVCRSWTLDSVSVYGDDIICPAHHAEAVMGILHEAGFTVNDKKSFWDGRFRESCGGHYWDGCDVTPFYIRKRLRTNGSAITTHNNSLAWRARHRTELDAALRQLEQGCQTSVPRFLYGPYGVDGCLWAPWDRACPKWNKRYQAYSQKTVKTVRWLEDQGQKWGSVLAKLWVENPDTETSWGAKADSMEVVSTTTVYRDQWDEWPARLS